MLPAPARDDAARAVATVARLADDPRCRRLDALERLWKGEPPAGLADFWDTSVPLHERAPCVSSGIVEAAVGRLADLVFGEGRYPATTVGASAYGVAYGEPERGALDDLTDEVERVAAVPVLMAKLLEQGAGVSTCVVVAGVTAGRLTATPVAAKWCTPTFGADGELTQLEVRYRFDRPDPDRPGASVTWWYRRLLTADADTVWEAPARPDGYLPEWGEPVHCVAHGFGFVPARWHRNDPDPSDTDPLDGTALFAGREDEVLALDMAMSQRHRNGRYNGEPQMVRIGAGEKRASMGEQGATAGPPKGWSWFNSLAGSARRWFGGDPAVKKGPTKIWDLEQGADAKLLESTGAGAEILGKDIAGLRAAILEARRIVIAAPETIAANASAALLREIYAPMVNLAGRYRAEYGAFLVEVLNLLLRVAYAARSKGRFVALRTLDAAMPALARCTVPVATDAPGVTAPTWVGVPIDLAWGDYFEPTWGDVQAAVTAAVHGNGGRPVLTLAQSVRLVAKVAGTDDVDATVAQLEREAAATDAQTTRVLGALGGDGPPPFGSRP